MRPALFWAHVAMMPRLQAEESLARVQDMAAAFGSMEERDQKSYLRQLRRAANGGRAEPSVKATRASLAAIGIPVIDVPVASEEG